MAKLIIVCGLPGTGKTTLATELSKKLGIFCVHKDSIKESLFTSLELSSLEDSKKIGYPSVKIALDITEENLAKGVPVILESPFRFPDEGEVFEGWKKKYGIDLWVFVLQISQKERLRRFTGRERHRAHRDTERMRMIEDMQCSYDHMPEKKIFLDANKSLPELLSEVMKHLT